MNGMNGMNNGKIITEKIDEKWYSKSCIYNFKVSKFQKKRKRLRLPDVKQIQVTQPFSANDEKLE